VVIYYAIRKRGTKLYLPTKHGKDRDKGFTYREPTDKSPPRLFTRIGDAKFALGCWASGRWAISFTHDEGIAEASGPEPMPTAGRSREDFEIIRMKLHATKFIIA
jgi:hypothetical protein